MELTDLPQFLCLHFLVQIDEHAKRETREHAPSRTIVGSFLLTAGLMATGCGESKQGAASSDPELANRGSIEVTARLEEIPEGAIFERELYNYATVLKYKVLEVHRGKVRGDTIYVGHYNPFKPRSQAADKRVKDVGGNLESFRAGQVHRMALEESMLEHFTRRNPQQVFRGRHRPDLLGGLDESGPGQELTGRARPNDLA